MIDLHEFDDLARSARRTGVISALAVVAVLAFLLVASFTARAENCISMVLKTAKYSVTKTARVATAWKTVLVVNPTTGVHEPQQVATAWTNETVSMGTFVGIAEVIAALKGDTAPGIAYKITQPTTIYAGAVPSVPAAASAQGWKGMCIDAIDDRLLIVRPRSGS